MVFFIGLYSGGLLFQQEPLAKGQEVPDDNSQ